MIHILVVYFYYNPLRWTNNQYQEQHSSFIFWETDRWVLKFTTPQTNGVTPTLLHQLQLINTTLDLVWNQPQLSREAAKQV